MRKGLGIAFVALGILCLLGAVGLLVYNHLEAENAEKTSGKLLEEVQSAIEERKMSQSTPERTEEGETAKNAPRKMETVSVDGGACIGILSIPTLGVELPVLTDWSYAKLKKAPCLYYGSYYESDFVIAAHNYRGHFGRLSSLSEGDPVLFTDVALEGVVAGVDVGNHLQQLFLGHIVVVEIAVILQLHIGQPQVSLVV